MEKTNSRAPTKYVSIEWALILLVFVRRSANVNLTRLDQNGLPRILLNSINGINKLRFQSFQSLSIRYNCCVIGILLECRQGATDKLQILITSPLQQDIYYIALFIGGIQEVANFFSIPVSLWYPYGLKKKANHTGKRSTSVKIDQLKNKSKSVVT